MPDPDPDELILRGISPRHVDEGEVSPGAFELSTADKGANRLSGARETLQTPSGLRAEQEALRPGSLAEVRAVSVAEIEDAGELRVIDDHHLVQNITGHASIDFSKVITLPKSLRLLVRTQLADYANGRPRLDGP